MEHHHYSSHMVSVSDGSLQGTDSCLGLLMDQTQPSKARREVGGGGEHRRMKGDKEVKETKKVRGRYNLKKQNK